MMLSINRVVGIFVVCVTIYHTVSGYAIDDQSDTIADTLDDLKPNGEGSVTTLEAEGENEDSNSVSENNEGGESEGDESGANAPTTQHTPGHEPTALDSKENQNTEDNDEAQFDTLEEEDEDDSEADTAEAGDSDKEQESEADTEEEDSNIDGKTESDAEDDTDGDAEITVDTEEDEDETENNTPEEPKSGSEEEKGENTIDEDAGVTLKRRRRAAPMEIPLSKFDHPLEVSLVLLDHELHHRVKRTSFNESKSTWPHHIPYVFDKSLKPAQIETLKEVLEFLTNRLCIEYTLEENFDPSNPNWFKEHGYSTNAYLRFKNRASCAAVYGRGSRDKGARNLSPCTQFFVMMHEVIHSLGGIHSQNYPFRERYITLHPDNIARKGKHNYRKEKPDSKEVEYEEFDPSSVLMYSRAYFTKNGLNAFDYIRPDMATLTGTNTYDNIFMEINKNYKCQETECKDSDPDCGTGYLGFINRKCGCICPSGFDPATKCKSLINAPDTSLKWPDASFTMYKAKTCPEGMEEGRISMPLKKTPRMNGIKLPYGRKLLKLDTCTKTSSSHSLRDWPAGTYCVVKPQDAACESPFKEGEFTIATAKPPTISGKVGDESVDGNKVHIKYCCRKEGDYRFPMKLPTDTPFRLVNNYYYCQEVDGMWPINGVILLSTKASKKGAAPQSGVNKRGIRHSSCYYQPPTYGCSETIDLNESNPSQTISVPMVSNYRAPNKRCFYYVKAPKGSQIRITFQKLSLHSYDKILVKRFNLLENPFKINLKNPPHQMITERHELFLEYWTYYKKSSKYKGAEFTVDLLAEKDRCYDSETNGADYAGKKGIAETYEECVAWKDATQCPDFPWDGTNSLHLLNSGKSCRNLDTVGMLQPWCYGYVNATMCTRRYCDVCNDADPTDSVQGCEDFTKDENFCKDATGRFGCFKSCKMEVDKYDKTQVKCGKPSIPAGVNVEGDIQDSYDVGASISVTCGGQASTIECTTLGWTSFADSCSAECIDASQLCQNAIDKFAEFCSNANSKASAEKYCKKSCGLCNAAKCTATGGSSYSLAPGSSGSLSTGQNAVFACNEGKYHVSGDLKRACSISGELLGTEPVCDDKPLPNDLNFDQVYFRPRTVPKAQAHLMLGDGLQVPFDGKITRWYYVCVDNRPITLLVYRKTSNPKKFTLVGYTDAKCVPKWPWSYDIPSGKEINVQKGDVIGVHNYKASVTMQHCGMAAVKNTPLAVVKAKKSSSLTKKSSTTFSGKSCGFIAISARVEPN